MRLTTFNDVPTWEMPYFIPGRRKPRLRTLQWFEAEADLPGPWRAVILAGDLQGRTRAPDGSWRLVGHEVAETLEEMADDGRLQTPYAVVLAGDLWSDPAQRRMGGFGDVTAVWEVFNRSADWVVGVLGNHDGIQRERLVEIGATLLEGRICEHDGLTVGGVSGIIGNPNKPNRLSKEDYLQQLRSVLMHQPMLAVTHQGPRFYSDRDKGSEAITELYASSCGQLAVSGHCRWPDPRVEDHRNVFLNVDARCMVLRASG